MPAWCLLLPALQVRITGGIQQLLPSFLPGLLFGPPVPLERLVLDDERGILYSLAANNALQVRGVLRRSVTMGVNVLLPLIPDPAVPRV